MASDPDEPRRSADVAEGTSAGSQNARGSGDVRETRSDSRANRTAQRSGDGDIVVPVDLYKTVTVFSTLIAVAFVVLGFLFLDAATGAVRRVALLGWLVGLAVPVACYLGYLRLRPNGRTAERVVVGVVLFSLSAAGVPSVFPGVPAVVRSLLAAASLTDGQYQALFGIAGLALIAVGAGVYILGARFRTEGMGNPKDDAD